MVAVEQTIFVLLLILILGLVIPELFKKLRLPFITSLILAGAFFGPNGFGYIQPNEVIEFFGFLGAVFLMFMAGLEVKLSYLKRIKGDVGIMAVLNGIIPFMVGVTIVRLFGFSWVSALLIGVVFISSSIAVIAASVRGTGLMDKKIGKAIVSAAVMEDMASLLLLAVILQTISPITKFPSPIYFSILILSLALIIYLLPRAHEYFIKFVGKRGDYEEQVRFTIVVLMAVLVYFSGLGVHPIVAAFLVGLLLSDIITSEVIRDKLHTLGYGLFVPVFFFIIGMQMELSMFTHFDYRDVLLISIIGGLIASKFFSGYIAGRIVGFKHKHSTMFGVTSTAQLTTTLAVVYTASSLQMIDSTLLTAIIILSIVTTIGVPVMLSFLSK